MIYLYIKQHADTGLKYFGRTTCVDPLKYKGSGTYWKSHLKKHGDNVNTIKLWGFDSMDECSKFASEFSNENNIVKSNQWANLTNEDGFMGAVRGDCNRLSAEARNAISQRMKVNNPMKRLRTNKGSFKKGHSVKWTDVMKKKASRAKQGRLNPNFRKPETAERLNIISKCTVCGVTANKGNIKRWHDDNCKHALI